MVGTAKAGAPVLDPTWERAGVKFPRANSLAALPPGTDAQAPGHHTGSFDAECLGGTRVLVADAAV